MEFPKEVCFGCGVTRLLDLSPQWDSVKVKDWCCPLPLCDDCCPKVKSFMKERNVTKIYFLVHLDIALKKASWLSLRVQKIKDKLLVDFPEKYAELISAPMTIEQAWLLSEGT
jgi:hypothetical protein